MKEKKSPPSPEKFHGLRRLLTLLTVIFLLLSLLAFAEPTAKKKNVLKAVGGAAEESLQLMPAMLSYYDGDLLTTLAANPGESGSYRYVSDALGALRTAGGFDSVTFIVKSEKQYLCAADGLLNSGANTYAAGSLLSPSKSVKSLLDKIWSGKSDGGTAADLIAGRAGGSAACVLLPVFGADESLLGVLAAEISVGEADYHMLGPVNLYVLGGVCLLIAAVLAGILFLLKKLSAKKPPAPPADTPDDTTIYTPAGQTNAEPAAPESGCVSSGGISPPDPALPGGEEAVDAPFSEEDPLD